MMSVILARSSTYALELIRNREPASGLVSASVGDNRNLLPPDPRGMRPISPAVADVLLSFSDTASKTGKTGPRSQSNPAQQTGQSRDHPTIIDGVAREDLTKLWLILNAVKAGRIDDARMKALNAPSYLIAKLQKFTIRDLSGDVEIRVDDKSIVEGARDNVLGIIHYHYEDKKAQDWMEEHFGRSGEMNCDPNDPCVQAVLNGTAKIFRGTDIPEVGLWSQTDKVYRVDPVSQKQEVVGTTTSGGIRKDFVSDFEKDNPGYGVRPVYVGHDVALVVYAKP